MEECNKKTFCLKVNTKDFYDIGGCPAFKWSQYRSSTLAISDFIRLVSSEKVTSDSVFSAAINTISKYDKPYSIHVKKPSTFNTGGF